MWSPDFVKTTTLLTGAIIAMTINAMKMRTEVNIMKELTEKDLRRQLKMCFSIARARNYGAIIELAELHEETYGPL
jgi:hypothetical protein